MSSIGEVLAYRRRLLGAILCFAATVLTVVASFLPLIVSEVTYEDETEWVKFTSWGFAGDEDSDLFSPVFGYPMVFAAVVMFVAAAGLLVSGLPSVRLGTGRAAATISLAGTAMLIGITWAIALHSSSFMKVVKAANDGPDDPSIEIGLGVGFWLLVAGLASAVVATVLVKLPSRWTWASSADYVVPFNPQPPPPTWAPAPDERTIPG